MNTLLQHKASMYMLAVVLLITVCGSWYAASESSTYSIKNKEVSTSWNAATAGSFIFN